MAAYSKQFESVFDQPKFIGKPKIYMIASTPRCGSHFLGHMLTSCGKFGVPLEYLHRGNLKTWRKRFNTLGIEDTFKELFQVRTTPNGCFGFKAHWLQYASHLDSGLFDNTLNFDHVIWIYRENLLSQSISLAIARQTGEWISGVTTNKKAKYNFNAIIRAASQIRKSNQAWKQHLFERPKRISISVSLENLTHKPEDTLSAIAQFIGNDVNYKPCFKHKTEKQANKINADWKTRFLKEMPENLSWIREPQNFSDSRPVGSIVHQN